MKMFEDKLGFLKGANLSPAFGMSFAEGGTGDAGAGEGAGGEGAGEEGAAAVGEGGAAGKGAAPAAGDWKEKLDVSIKNHPSLESFKTPEEAIKAYVAVQPLIGREKLPVPKDENDTQALDLIADRLGRPKTPDEYKLPDVKYPEGFPKDMMKAERIKEFKAIAHKARLLPSQTNALFQWYMGNQTAEYNTFMVGRSKARAEAETQLRQTFGKDYENRVGLAKKVVAEFASPEEKAALEEGLGNDPRFIKMLSKIGESMAEDGITGKGGELTMSPDEANAEILKIQGEKKHPYWDKMHPEHNLAVKRMEDLFAMANPEKAKE